MSAILHGLGVLAILVGGFFTVLVFLLAPIAFFGGWGFLAQMIILVLLLAYDVGKDEVEMKKRNKNIGCLSRRDCQ